MTDLLEAYVTESGNKIDNAFGALEKSLEKYIKHIEEQTKAKVTNSLRSEIETLKDEIKNLSEGKQDSKGEISHLSAELVKLKNENKKLREVNDKIAELIGQSIEEIERLVAA